jgi:hypothetical protein
MGSVAAATKRVDDVEKELNDLLEEAEMRIAPEKRDEFAHQVELLLLNANIKLIEMLSKEARARSEEHLPESARRWHELRAKSEILKRRLQLTNPSTPQDFSATLMWMAELGGEEELNLIRQVKQSPPFSSEMTQRLMSIAEQRIYQRQRGSDGS